jgi:hypothetical protein
MNSTKHIAPAIKFIFVKDYTIIKDCINRGLNTAEGRCLPHFINPVNFRRLTNFVVNFKEHFDLIPLLINLNIKFNSNLIQIIIILILNIYNFIFYYYNEK